MMGGGPGGGRFGNMLNQETLKPRNLGETLGRLGAYFGRFWYMFLVSLLVVVLSTWMNVTTPVLTGQATDCFLVPTGNGSFGGVSFGPSSGSQSNQADSPCWLASTNPSKLSFTNQLVYHAFRIGGYEVPNLAGMTGDQRVAALFRLIVIVTLLYVGGSLLFGATFFTMSWTGQHVLRQLRV